MDELEFCLKSISYPLGMLLEGKERRKGESVKVSTETITLPDIPFGALCYLVGVAIFDALDEVDKRRLEADYKGLNEFKKKLLSSKLGGSLRQYMTSPGRFISPSSGLSIDWLEFQRRKEKVVPYLKKLRDSLEASGNRREYLERSSFVDELTLDQGLLLGYLAKDEKEKELVNSALGKHNHEYREMAKRYFKALQG
ncbi:hypothetical protein [Thermococcus gorgonarius]|uniref:Uncharacterized protein n=1 Tax=Thermococcus gorgonarius TaxID=71997 RepID=A0A2Z2MBZ6_THEGO|nr:hypothetical protein [Thermococcus gorgonarius]ASJ00081.1 hypothetical protein A3K92_00560 [Thermococcus gorgonarius]